MMQVRAKRLRVSVVWALALVFGMVLTGGASGAAQQTGTLPEAARPGHIHEGSCADLGEVAFPLTPATINGEAEGAVDLSEAEGSAAAFPVYGSATEVEGVTIADLLEGEYAVNFHESEDNIQNYIACGDIGGVVTEDGDLLIGLAELNNSGYTGVAVLDGDDDELEVTVLLSPVNSAGEAAATPVAEGTPEAAGGAEAAVAETTVHMQGRQFDPVTIMVPAGTTVTWVNDDSVAHTVTARDDSFDSGTLDPGDTFQYTFDTPGAYEYVCIFHAGMAGTVIVT